MTEEIKKMLQVFADKLLKLAETFGEQMPKGAGMYLLIRQKQGGPEYEC